MLRVFLFTLGLGAAIGLARWWRGNPPQRIAQAPVERLNFFPPASFSKIEDELQFMQAAAYFKVPDRLEFLKAEPERLAVVIRQPAEYGWNVFFCVFNQRIETVTDMEAHAARSLDEQFLRHFGDKDVLILK